MRKMPKAEKLLLAAYRLEQSGKRPFSAEDLVVAAWREYPDSFALAGYPQHPDSNRVYFEIMGNKSFRKKGWLDKTGEKKYQLSPAGSAAAAVLSGITPGPTAGGKSVPLGRDELDQIQALWLSTAAEMYRTQRQNEIVFRDACSFWGISPRSTASMLTVRQGSVIALIEKAVRSVEEGGPVSIAHGSIHLGPDSMNLLARIHSLLVEKFQAELAIIGGRTDNRSPKRHTKK